MFHKAKKYLGQNFLKSSLAVNALCSSADLNKDDIVLEIGPGKGALTSKILERVERVIAIEKDNDLIEILNDKFKEEVESGKLLIINEDIMNINPNKIGLLNGKYKIVANIPYNITGLIFKKFLSEETKPSIMSILVQKEVADRIATRDGKESILSLSVKAYGEPKYIMKVGKNSFSPSPKVDSAIILIREISEKKLNGINEKLFFEIIKLGFAHKRKILKKNLENLNRDLINKYFIDKNISPSVRAEDLSFDNWVELTKVLQNG